MQSLMLLSVANSSRPLHRNVHFYAHEDILTRCTPPLNILSFTFVSYSVTIDDCNVQRSTLTTISIPHLITAVSRPYLLALPKKL